MEPCDICGDVGGPDSVFTCCECKIARQHAYCMRVLSQVPVQFWFCEDCEESKRKHSLTSAAKVNMPEIPMVKSCGIVNLSSGGSEDMNKLRNSGRSHFKEKMVEKGKTKYISCDEAMKLSSGFKFSSPPKITIGSGSRSSKCNMSRNKRAPVKPKGVSPNIIVGDPSFRFSGQPNLSSPCPSRTTKAPSVVQQSASQSPKMQKENKALLRTENDDDECQQSNTALQRADEVKTTNQYTDTQMENNAALSSKNDDYDHEQPMDVPNCAELVERINTAIDMEMENNVVLPNRIECGDNRQPVGALVCAEDYCPYDPALNSYWIYGHMVMGKYVPEVFSGQPKMGLIFTLKCSLSAIQGGSFKLPIRFEYLEFNDALRAHPSAKVHHKVYEILKKMPEVIEFELVSQNEFISEIFTPCPYKDDIGLYFFPGNSGSNGKYLSFLEFIWTEKLVLRSSMDSVELLVLSSKLLHLESQKWKGNYFLWGVFRSLKRHKSNQDLELRSSNDPHIGYAEGENSKEIDMDVDTSALPWPEVKQEALNAGYIEGESSREIDMDIDPVALPQSEVKQEALDIIPPGFEEVCTRYGIPPGFEEVHARYGIPPGFEKASTRDKL